LEHMRRWRRLRRLWYDMDWFEVVAPEASGEAFFSDKKISFFSLTKPKFRNYIYYRITMLLY
jgi:hypothetical protein